MLSQQSCEACRADAPRLSETEIKTHLAELEGWQLAEMDEVKQFSRTFSFANFVDALAFANKVGELAESEGHHPALLVEWGRVTVRWWTHKIRGLHKNDAVMAAKTSELFAAP